MEKSEYKKIKIFLLKTHITGYLQFMIIFIHSTNLFDCLVCARLQGYGDEAYPQSLAQRVGDMEMTPLHCIQNTLMHYSRI